MKKSLLFCISMLILSLAIAGPITPKQARTAALNFMSRTVPTVTKSSSCQLAYAKARQSEGDTLFYVFNVGGGFVIVAADDAVTPILGYSPDGHFDPQNIPDNCHAWLQGYADQIAYVRTQELVRAASVEAEWNALLSTEETSPAMMPKSGTSVAPLLTTKWDQGTYYNSLCPEDDNHYSGHVWTGCVATAMAQLIRYHQWPAQGFGTHTYTHDAYGILTADFASTAYSYSLMPNELTSSSSSAQVNAVAALMHDCGVAVNMNYGPYGSSAYHMCAKTALASYFGYETRIACKSYRTPGIIIGTWNSHTYYDDETWHSMLKAELDAQRPIYYSGDNDNNNSGHSFVCDGYDNNNLFHFNWGWGGSLDGYFAIGSLNPGGDDYNNYNTAIFLQPRTSGAQQYSFNADGTSTMNVNGVLEITHPLGYNDGLTYGNWGAASGDTLILYPQTAGGQLLLEKITFLNNYSNGFRVYVYDGVGTSGSLLMSITNSNASDPVMSTAGALTIVSSGVGDVNNKLLLRVNEVACLPMVYDLTCTGTGYSTADFAWEVFQPASYATHNFNWQIEYGLHGFTPGTGTMVPSNTTSLSIGGLTADTEYDAYLRYTCSGGVSKMVGPVTFKTERVMVCFDEGIPYNSGPSSYAHDWSEQIYTAAELSASGLVAGDVLTAFSLQRTYTYNGNYFAEVTLTHSSAIYMGHTNEANFNTNGWLPLSAMTNVFTYKQTVYDIKETRWEKFEFDNPFVWDGHSNVVIAIADLEHSISSNNASVSPRTVYTSSESDSRHLYCNLMDPNPMILPDDYYRDNSRPLIRFCRQENCPDPSHLTYTSLNRHTVKVEWFPGYQETSWDVEYGSHGFARGDGMSVVVNSAPELTVSQLAAGTYDFYVRSNCGSDTSDWVSVSVPVGGFDCAQIGEGTVENQIFPMGWYPGNGWKYTYTQQLFTAAELAAQGVQGSITSISFQYGGTAQTKSPVSVYLGNTTQPDMGYEYTWIPSSAMQLVYSGSVTLENGWTTISFDTPFIWDGTSNLVVAILNNSGVENGTSVSYMHNTSQIMALERTYPSSIDMDNPGDISRYQQRCNMRFCGGGMCTLTREASVSIIEGSSYDFYGTSVSEPGTYTHRWFVSDECDSLVTLHLSVRKILFVTTTGSGSHNGSSWSNAMELQEAMDAASLITDRTPVLFVKKGTYTGSTSSDNSFVLKPNVTAYGGFNGNEPADYDVSGRTQANISQTILFGSNARRVLYQIENFPDSQPTLIDGFTIRGGTVNMVGEGGGAYIRKNCTLQNCVVTANNAAISGSANNVTFSGVAVYNNGGTLRNCEIHHNTVNLSGTGVGHNVYGVGVYNNNGLVADCNIHDNVAVYEGNGNNWQVRGGGIYDAQDGSSISDNSVTHNSAALGGGLYLQSGSTITRCVISNNTSRSNGGGIFADNYGSRFNHCLIGNNAAGASGGGVYDNRSTFISCDIVRNSAVTSGGGIHSLNGSTLQNTIVWGNKVGTSDNQISTNYSGRYFTCVSSAVQGGYSGAITLEAENSGIGIGYPRFTNPTAEAGVDVYNSIGDWTLQAGSVCADMGRNAMAGGTMDLAGNTRIQQARADIGAYESAYSMAFPIVPEAGSNVIYVTTTGAGAHDGSSWANATSNLQYAMDVAMNSNPVAAVWVAGGTYLPGKPLIVQPDVAVYGGFVGNEHYTYDLSQRNFTAHATIIDGDSAHRVLQMSCPFTGNVGTTETEYFTEPAALLMPVSGTLDVTACSGVIYDNGGASGSYANNCNGTIILRSYNPGSTITLSGSYHTETCCDKLYVYDGVGGNLLGTFRGTGNLNLTSVPNGILVLTFTSDGSATNSGFEIHFTCSNCTPDIPEIAEQTVSPFPIGINLFDGFTFRNGYASYSADGYGTCAYLLDNTKMQNCVFADNHGNPGSSSQAVHAENCVFSSCVFANNDGYGLYGKSLNISNCMAEENGSYGMYVTDNSTVSECEIRYNGSGLYLSGGKSNGCFVHHNGVAGSTSESFGVYSSNSAQIVNCTVTNNHCSGLYANGGLYVNMNIANNSSARNSSTSAAGVLARNNARFVNCNIVNNKATSTYSGSSNVRGGIYNYTSDNEYTNCIIWGNKSYEETGNLYGNGTFSYCAIEGGQSGIANIALDTLNNGSNAAASYVRFVNPTSVAGVSSQADVDWNLAPGSACVNAGNPNTTSLNLPLYDLGGSLRIKQNRIDIGAYEHGLVNSQNIYDTICLGESFFYDDYFVYPEMPGMFRDTFIYNQAGADYIAYINIMVNNIYNVNVSANICEGETYSFNGQTLSTTGTYPAYLQSSSGCDSTVILNLTVTPIVYNNISQTDCDSFIWNQTTYYATGDYIQTFEAVTGCDSIVTMHLTVNHSTASNDYLTLCRNALPYYYHGMLIPATTPEYDTVPVTLSTVHNCDSVVTLHLHIVDVIATEFSETACDSYTWNDITYTTGGDKVQTFTSAAGCDSVVTLHLTINPSVTELVEVTACDSYTWNDSVYTQSGDYTQSLATVHGCDSIVTLHLTIHPSVTGQDEVIACDSYSWNDSVYTVSGDYVQTLTTVHGCDSVVTLHLTINNSVIINENLAICENELPYHYVNGMIDTVFEQGTPASANINYTFSTFDGCDSTIVLHVTVVPAFTPETTVSGTLSPCVTSSATITANGSYSSYLWSNGETSASITVTTPGSYWVTAIDANGCHGVSEPVQLGLSELITETPAICMVGVENNHNIVVWEELSDPDVVSYQIYRENDQANVFDLLTVIPAGSPNAYEDVTADPSVRAWRYKITAADSCGGETPMSAYHKTVHLTINQGIGNSWNLIWTPYEGFEFASYKLYRGTASNNLQLIQTMPATLTSFTDNNPAGDALFYQIEVVMTESCVQHTRDMTYTGTRSNIVWNGVAVTAETTVAACESYDWNGEILTASGDYVQTLQTEQGYDSTVTLHLIILQPTPARFFETACESYTWTNGNGQTYTQSGTYTHAHDDANGCTQVDTLFLTIMQPPAITIYGNTTITAGESTILTASNNNSYTYLWNTGQTSYTIVVSPTETTTYTVTVYYGPCSSTASVTVIVNTGIDDHETQRLVLYPNPTSGKVVIDRDNVLSVEVFDKTGRLLTVRRDVNEIDLGAFADGIYTLRISLPDGVVIRKVIKAK